MVAVKGPGPTNGCPVLSPDRYKRFEVSPQSRFVTYYLAGSLAFAILYWNLVQVQYEFWIGPVGAVIFSGLSIAVILCGSKFKPRPFDRLQSLSFRLVDSVENNIGRLLVGTLTIYVIWAGVVIFSNPYEIYFNQGDGAAYTQYLYNLTAQNRPELSYISVNTVPVAGDLRFKWSGPYVSMFFWGATYWLPFLVLPPLYSIYPHPPMHVFSVLLVVVVIGVPGMYFALRKAGGSKGLAFFGAVGYLLLPHVAVATFNRGYFDYIALAVFPWVFGFLFARKWYAFYLSCICLGAVGYPFTHTTIAIGLVTAIFFRAPLHGLVVVIIGYCIMQWDVLVFETAVQPYYADGEKIPSFVEGFILNRTIGSLIPPFSFYLIYAGSILQSVGFFQFFGVRINGKWNFRVLGLLVLGLTGFAMLLFRSSEWTFQRNAMLFVPFYVAGLLGYIDWSNHQADNESSNSANRVLTNQKLGTIILVCCVTASIVCWTGWKNTAHFQRLNFLNVKPSEETKRFTKAIEIANSVIKPEDPLAIMASLELWAFFTNRQHVWYVGNEPPSVKYYLVIGYPNTNQAAAEEWERTINTLKGNQNLELIHDTSPAKVSAFSPVPIMIFKNLNEQPIPRNEALLGWGVIQRAFYSALNR